METTNVHERGTLEGDEMYPRGGEEGDLECKRAKAIQLLHEYGHSNTQQDYTTSEDRTLLHIMCGYQCDKAVNKNDTREVI